MIYIDKKIRIAISCLRQTCDTNEEAGNLLGVSGKHVSLILKGEVESIRPSTWETMQPALRPYLNESDQMMVCEQGASYRTCDPKIRNLCEWMENDATDTQKNVIFSMAGEMGFDRRQCGAA